MHDATSWLERVEAMSAACVLALAMIGLALLPITTTPYVRWMVTTVESSELTGLGEELTRDVAGQVLTFVTSRSAPPLPSEIGGRSGFDWSAVQHLIDVREVIVPARTLAVGLACALVAWALIRRRTRHGRRVIAQALSWAGLGILGAAVLVIAVGAVDFEGLFAAFHSLFFEAGTWVFPYDSLLIQVFPLPFWAISGLTWGTLTLFSAGAALLAGARIRFTLGNNGV